MEPSRVAWIFERGCPVARAVHHRVIRSFCLAASSGGHHGQAIRPRLLAGRWCDVARSCPHTLRGYQPPLAVPGLSDVAGALFGVLALSQPEAAFGDPGAAHWNRRVTGLQGKRIRIREPE
jgi:hypothetical protein